jgi:hypothetical protein
MPSAAPSQAPGIQALNFAAVASAYIGPSNRALVAFSDVGSLLNDGSLRGCGLAGHCFDAPGVILRLYAELVNLRINLRHDWSS